MNEPLNQPSVAACKKCNVALIAVQKKKLISISGLNGALVFLVGLVMLFGLPVVGILLMILGLLISVIGRGKKIVMTCPQCGAKGAVL